MSLASLSSLILSNATFSVGSTVSTEQANSQQVPVSPQSSASSASTTTYTATPTGASTSLTYAMPQCEQLASGAIWGNNDNTDTVSLVMGADVSSQTLAGRFTGLGAALLERFKTASSDFTQSVVIPPLPGQNPVTPNPTISATVALDVTTVSGNKIELDIRSGSDGMLAVQVHSDGNLTNADQTALANLASGFQGALDGLTADSPGVDISGLLQFDPTVFSSVDLNIQLQSESLHPTTFSFQADSAHRSIDVSMPQGTVNIDVNLANASVIGTQAQQNTAIGNYLQAFSQEQRRDPGGEDQTLMQAFADSFAQINSHYPPLMMHAAAAGPTVQSDQDHAMLTGLADFQASVIQTPTSSNKVKLDEVDHFSYQISQQTSISGRSNADRMIVQQQSASMNASYHKWIAPDPTQLQTTKLKKTQNYYYEQINDSASVTSTIGYQKNALTQASISKTASQSTHETKFTNGDKVEDATVSAGDTQTLDLMALLEPLQSDDSQDATELQQVLAAINAQVYLQWNPTQLQFGVAVPGTTTSAASDVASSVQ